MTSQCSQEAACASFGPVSESRDPGQGFCLADTSATPQPWSRWSIRQDGSGTLNPKPYIVKIMSSVEQYYHGRTEAEGLADTHRVSSSCFNPDTGRELQTESRRIANLPTTFFQKPTPGL